MKTLEKGERRLKCVLLKAYKISDLISFQDFGSLFCHGRFCTVTLSSKICRNFLKNLLFEIDAEMLVDSYCTDVSGAPAVYTLSVVWSPGSLALL